MLGDSGKRMIGLLMVRNEADILQECLEHAVQFFDRIYVLEGSVPESEFRLSKAILERFAEVRLVIKDADTEGPFPIRDGARHYLLQAVRRDCGTGHWIGILHGDEIHTRDPRVFLRKVNPAISPVVQVRLCHCYLHSSDKHKWEEIRDLPIASRVTHCMWPGTPEDRFFYDSGSNDYDPHKHSLVVPVPHGQGRHLLDNVVIKQYNYRDPGQMLSRARQRISSRWQRNHYQHIANDEHYFVDSLHVAGYPPCGYDNVKETNSSNWSKPRSLLTDPLVSWKPEAAPVFVGGIGRSGTTLCKRLLGLHSCIAALEWESKLISFPDGLMDLLYAFSEDKLLRFRANMQNANPTTFPEFECREVYNWLFRARNGEDSSIAGLDSEIEYLSEHLCDQGLALATRQKLVAQFTHFLFDRVALKNHAPMWVEQTPMNMFWAAEILQTFPTSHFVYIARDPRDVVASLIQRWWAPAGLTECIDYCKKRLQKWQQARQAIVQQNLGTRLIEVRFEDLVADPTATLGKVFTQLRVEPRQLWVDRSKAN